MGYTIFMITAKQNQKFPFHFLSAPPPHPTEENKKGKENFWFLLPRPNGADEARRLVGIRILLKMRSDFLVQREQYKENTNNWCFLYIAEESK